MTVHHPIPPSPASADTGLARVRAVVFDMDGVLIESEPVWELVRADIARELGHSWLNEDQYAVMGVSTARWTEYMFQRLQPHAMSAQALQQRVIERMEAQYREFLPLRRGAVEAVRRLAARYPLALATGSPMRLARYVLQAAGIEDCFGPVLTSDDLPRGKPAPDIYLAAADQLGVPPSACVGIEDSGNGLRALLAAGMPAVAAPMRRYPLALLLLAQCHAKLVELDELTPELIEHAAAQAAQRA